MCFKISFQKNILQVYTKSETLIGINHSNSKINSFNLHFI
jgi:hypothetical protein